MQRILTTCFLLTFLLAPLIGFAQESNVVETASTITKKRFIEIPVNSAIMKPQLFVLRRGVEKAIADGYDGIVLTMDTPGGRVDVMQDIVNTIIDLDIPTYTFIEKNALSAGAVIAMATDYIYMNKGSVIGAATPIIAGANGAAEVGEAEREKMESAMDAIGRTIAQVKGREEMLIRCMIRDNLEFKIGDTVISAKDELLTLTYLEANQTRPDNGEPLLSLGTVSSVQEMLELAGETDFEVVALTSTWADDLASLITTISPILMVLALLAFYAESSSPGIGWFGGLAIMMMAIVLFGHNVAGLAGMEDVLILALGVVLVMVELLVIPGFGLFGVAGIACILWGLFSSMVERYPGNPGDLPGLDSVANVGPAMTNLLISVVGSVALGAWILHFLSRSDRLHGGLVLDAATSTEEGYTSQSDDFTDLTAGTTGVAKTDLRPSGAVKFGNQVLDVIADGGFVDAGQPVHILEVRGNRILVAPEENASS